jgi:hypothetical protein
MSRPSRSLFQTIRSEGGLLPADLLQRVAQGDRELRGLRAEDYHLTDLPLNEAIVRSWNRLVGAWVQFRDARRDLPKGDAGTTLTRERWLLILFEELRFGRLQTARAVEIDGKSYPVSHAWDHVPIHFVGSNVPLDRRSAGVVGAATHSPHGLLQELLNRSEERLWGYVSNGLLLRLLRDNSSFTRQAYLEFDLEEMMESEAYSDFVLLWLTCHQSRVEGERPYECWLERWSQEAAKQGTRALDSLRAGVETAIREFGSGFLALGNSGLRDALRSGELSTQDYYRQLLRLVYRLLFLFVAEDRGLLHDPRASDTAKERYGRWYSTKRLRDLAQRRRGTKHGDLWEGLKLVMAGLASDDGCKPLGLPALGSFLWSDRALVDLNRAQLSNRALLEALRALASVRDGKVLRAVDYKNLGAEELGSVYESLLELHPELDADAGTFALNVAAGSERKTTGSYYTPTSLISVLLDSSLDPVLEEAVAMGEEAILALKVVDPACGSGHFLVAAAHRIAKRLASRRTGDEEPSPEAMRHALRDVVSNCIYGVDVNAMSVELCKVSLWMEALDPGRPLSFLDAHVKCGNSLLGTTLTLIEGGIPDDAFAALDADDSAVVKSLRKQNAEERGGQLTLAEISERLVDALALDAAALEATDDTSVEALREKERRFELNTSSEAYKRFKEAADAWCAAFVYAKTASSPRITTGLVRRMASAVAEVSPDVRAHVAHVAEQYGFFHWEVEFPHVFHGSRAGFDVVLGNPPWEQVIFQDREFFAARSPEIARVSRSAERQKLIAALQVEDPSLHEEYSRALQTSKGQQHFLRRSGLFPLSGVGRHLVTGGLFVEGARRVAAPAGSVGLIVPSEVATGDTLRLLFREMIEDQTLQSLFDFENGQIFPAVDSRYKFSLLTLGGANRLTAASTFVYFAEDPSDVMDPARRFSLTAQEFALINPRSRNCPIFRNAREATIATTIYRGRGILGDGWDLETRPGLFNMALQSGLFRTAEGDRDLRPRCLGCLLAGCSCRIFASL